MTVLSLLLLGAACAGTRRAGSVGVSRSATPHARAGCRATIFQSRGKAVNGYQCLPAGAGLWPAVILLHGVEGATLNGEAYHTLARQLAEQGFAALFIDYFSQTPDAGLAVLHPNPFWLVTDFPIWLFELGDAISYLGRVPGVDPRRIGLIGFSLGSELALAGGTVDARLKGIVEYYGGLEQPFASAAHKLPPVLILHGDADTTVPVSRAYALRDSLTALGKPFSITIYPTARHAFNFPGSPTYNAAAAADANARMLAFLRTYLAPS